MVIDPTMFSAERDTTQRTYFVMKVFDELKEYISAIDEENGYPSLAKYLWSVEMKAQAWGNKNGYFFIG